MIKQGSSQVTPRSSWAIPVAIIFLLIALLFIAGTIVLSLIPIYLGQRDVGANTNLKQMSFNTIYASDVTDGQSLTLSNINDLSNQMLKSIPHLKNSMDIQSGQFLSAKASSRRKRQTSNTIVTCEQPTGLFGDLLTSRYIMKYPPLCSKLDCGQRYLNQIQNSIRNRHHRITVTMHFTDGETRVVQLAFCGFSTTDINVATINTTNTTNMTNPTNSSQCTADTSKSIYLLDQDNNFFQFNPTTYDVTFVSTINCSTTAYPYSMAVQRDGTAWTLYTDGNLYTFDITTVQCQSTSFLSEQTEPILFGMNFATDESTNTEKLYISSDSSNTPFRLATIDVDSLEISIITYYESIYARAELTGTNDGKLFGLFEGTPFTIAEINQTNGQILSKSSQDIIQYISDSSHFALASYLSNFFLFVGDSTSTDIFLYDSLTQTTSKKTTISNGIVGAGTSTCT